MHYLVERNLVLVLVYFPALQNDSSSFVSTTLLGNREGQVWGVNAFFPLKARGNGDLWCPVV